MKPKIKRKKIMSKVEESKDKNVDQEKTNRQFISTTGKKSKISKSYTLSRFKDVIEKLKLAGLINEEISRELDLIRKAVLVEYVKNELE